MRRKRQDAKRKHTRGKKKQQARKEARRQEARSKTRKGKEARKSRGKTRKARGKRQHPTGTCETIGKKQDVGRNRKGTKKQDVTRQDTRGKTQQEEAGGNMKEARRQKARRYGRGTTHKRQDKEHDTRQNATGTGRTAGKKQET